MLCVALTNVSVCFVCCVLDSVCELFGETIRDVYGVVVAEMLWMCLVCVEVLCWIDRVGLPHNVRGVPVIPVCI